MKKKEFKKFIDAEDLIGRLDFLSLAEIEDLLKWLDDKKFLSSSGQTFRRAFWNMNIKKKNNHE